MDKKVYYGEYTLRHWIELILEKNVVLPEYQRSFVWKDYQVKRFLKNLVGDGFVPPVVIGYSDRGDTSVNFIIDGQQRLTSILLGYLGRFPKTTAFKLQNDDSNPPLYSTKDIENDEVDEELPLQWTLKEITDKDLGKTKAEILSKIDVSMYDTLDVSLEETKLDEIFLGFTYLVPKDSDKSHQQKFYCNVFHDINLQGKALQRIESRRSLYFLDDGYEKFFEPDFCKMLKIGGANRIVSIYDYVRALAFLSEYTKANSEATIARSCNSSATFEIYYENYINAVICDDDDQRFGKFSTTIGNENVDDRTARLTSYVDALGFKNQPFPTIIDADTSLFGLIYQVMFCGKRLDDARISGLKTALRNKINSYKVSIGQHAKNPNSLKFIRLRIKESIVLYSRYIQQ